MVEIKEIFKDNNNSMLLFGFSLIMATVVVIFVVIFFNLLAQHTRARKKIRRNKKSDANYIFIGINNASLTLATDLLKNNSHRLVIFIQNSKKRDDQLLLHKASKLGASIISKESFFDKISIKNEEFLFSVNEEVETENDINLFENNYLQAHKLNKCIKKRNTHIFLFSTNEEGNTFAAQSIIHELEKYTLETNVSIYIRTIAQGYLEEQFYNCRISNTDNIQIKFINDAQIAAQQLILHNPPVNYVDPDISVALARKDFKPLILGFGFMGQACLRKLVEMGQFLNKDFSALIIDQNMDNIIGQFNFNYPGLIKNYKIKFVDTLFGHTDFYDLINNNPEFLEHFMYVVISLGNDNLNMQSALEISKLSKRLNRRVRVFVHLNDVDNFSHLLENSPEFTCFGYDNEVFTESNIIQGDLERRAINNHNFYINHSDKDRKVAPWAKLSKMKQISNISAMEHQQTKLKLMGLTEEEIAGFKNEADYLHHLGETRLTNLAKAEHLRWNANYFAHGWDTWELSEIKGKITSDDVRKLHACLVDWDALDLIEKKIYEVKKYDEIAVKKIFEQITNEQNDDLKSEEVKIIRKARKHNKQKDSELSSSEIEELARKVHIKWMLSRLEAGWQQGPRRDDEKKEHPSIIPYEKLPEEEKEYDRQTVLTTIKGLIENGYEIRKKDK